MMSPTSTGFGKAGAIKRIKVEILRDATWYKVAFRNHMALHFREPVDLANLSTIYKSWLLFCSDDLGGLP